MCSSLFENIIWARKLVYSVSYWLSFEALTQPPSAEDHRQAQKDGQAGPGDAVQGRLGAAGAAEHWAAAGSQAAHAISFRAMEQHQNDQ